MNVYPIVLIIIRFFYKSLQFFDQKDVRTKLSLPLLRVIINVHYFVFSKHLARDHGGKCVECDFESEDLSDLEKHMKIHCALYSCTECDFSASEFDALNEHTKW